MCRRLISLVALVVIVILWTCYALKLSPRSLDPRNALKPLVYIHLMSAAGHFDRRQAIRETWLTQLLAFNRTFDYKVEFILGTPLNQTIEDELVKESQRHGDLLRIPEGEHYANITFKTKKSLVRAFIELGAEYIFKVDDDSYVRPEKIISFLEGRSRQRSLAGGDPLYWGAIFHSHIVVREPGPTNWLYASPETYPDSKYPVYATGTGYIVGRGLGHWIASRIDQMIVLQGAEDTALGVWIETAQKHGYIMDLVDVKGAITYVNQCKLDSLIVHRMYAAEQRCMYDRILNNPNEIFCCSKEEIDKFRVSWPADFENKK